MSKSRPVPFIEIKRKTTKSGKGKRDFFLETNVNDRQRLGVLVAQALADPATIWLYVELREATPLPAHTRTMME